MPQVKANSPHIPVFPLGPQSYFHFHLEHLFFLDIDETIQDVLSIDPKDIVNKSVFYLFDKLSIPAHLKSTYVLFQKGMDYLRIHSSPHTSVNLEFNVEDSLKNNKRILFQFQKGRSVLTNEQVGLGRITDIDHVYTSGSPVLTILKNNKVEKVITYDQHDTSDHNGYNLKSYELEVLKLKSKGLKTQDIAETLHKSTLTIYSIIRNIKVKTGKATIPLIKELTEKGVI